MQAYDPEATGECARIYGKRQDLLLCHSREEALIGADALVICTEWKAFRTIEPDLLKRSLNYPIVVDGRNLFDPKTMADAGILYYAIGRGEKSSKLMGNDK